MTKTPTAGELKPCPFCGGTDLKHGQNGVFCNNNACEACIDFGHFCGRDAKEEKFCLDTVARAWNTRAHQPKPTSGEVAEAVLVPPKNPVAYSTDNELPYVEAKKNGMGVWFRIGNQSFRLAAEFDEGEDPEKAKDWYVNQLNKALDNLTTHIICKPAAQQCEVVEEVTTFQFNAQVRLLCKDGMQFSEVIQHLFPHGLRIVDAKKGE